MVASTMKITLSKDLTFAVHINLAKIDFIESIQVNISIADKL